MTVSLAAHLIGRQDLAVHLLHLPQLPQEVPERKPGNSQPSCPGAAHHAICKEKLLLQQQMNATQCCGAPELRLCAHGVCSPELHSVYCGLGLLLCGQVAAHHLVLVVFIATLRSAQGNISAGILHAHRKPYICNLVQSCRALWLRGLFAAVPEDSDDSTQMMCKERTCTMVAQCPQISLLQPPPTLQLKASKTRHAR